MSNFAHSRALVDSIIDTQDGSMTTLAKIDESAESELLHFQPGSNEIERWAVLYHYPEATRENFLARLERLLPSLPVHDGKLASAEQEGATLVRNLILEFAQSNLSFDERGIGSDGLGVFDALKQA